MTLWEPTAMLRSMTMPGVACKQTRRTALLVDLIPRVVDGESARTSTSFYIPCNTYNIQGTQPSAQTPVSKPGSGPVPKGMSRRT